MRQDDLTYGAHSGIQKAIRRGDLDLTKTCLDIMWPVKKERNWLKWRVTVLVEEDVFGMIGELPKFFAKVKGLHGAAEAKTWRKFLYELTLCKKAKDAEALYWASELPEQEDDHEELKEFRFWRGMATSPVEVAEEMLKDIVDSKYRKLSEYELNAVKLLSSRTKMGGMSADRFACVSGMLLVAMRGLDEEAVEEELSSGFKRWKKEKDRKPRTTSLGWYVFDIHTVVGKFASSVFMKRKARKFGLSKEKLHQIWFDLESAWIPTDLMKLVPYNLDGKLTCFDSMWWPYMVKRDLAYADYSARQVKKLWDTKIRKELKSIVEWCMEKRSDDEGE